MRSMLLRAKRAALPICSNPFVLRFVMVRTMKQRTDKVLSSKDKDVGMSDTAFYSGVMREAYPVPCRYGSVKAAINEAVKFIGPKVTKPFTHRRARSIWEGTARRIDAEEASALHQAEIEETRREYRELQGRLASLETSLALADEAFFGPSLAAYRALADGLGHMDRARNDGR